MKDKSGFEGIKLLGEFSFLRDMSTWWVFKHVGHDYYKQVGTLRMKDNETNEALYKRALEQF